MAFFQFALQNFVLVLVVLTVALLVYLRWRVPVLLPERAGQMLLFLGVFVLPIVVGMAGFSQNMERATETRFCLSCHEMRPYGQSLYIDDEEIVPASHFQNRRIPRDQACFTCHTDYSLFGDYKAKLNGLRHVYVHFLGTVPDKIHLYRPFNNRNCLHCHEGMRRFEESKHHQSATAPRADIESGKVSCISKGCHDTGHMIDEVHELDMWKPKTDVLIDGQLHIAPPGTDEQAAPKETEPAPAAATPSDGGE